MISRHAEPAPVRVNSDIFTCQTTLSVYGAYAVRRLIITLVHAH